MPAGKRGESRTEAGQGHTKADKAGEKNVANGMAARKTWLTLRVEVRVISAGAA
jgi:hypothetical protein